MCFDAEDHSTQKGRETMCCRLGVQALESEFRSCLYCLLALSPRDVSAAVHATCHQVFVEPLLYVVCCVSSCGYNGEQK